MGGVKFGFETNLSPVGRAAISGYCSEHSYHESQSEKRTAFAKKGRPVKREHMITLKIFEQRHISHCRAGVMFLAVMPDGSSVLCSRQHSKYATRKQMAENHPALTYAVVAVSQ
jgi:hypothetical protein